MQPDYFLNIHHRYMKTARTSTEAFKGAEYAIAIQRFESNHSVIGEALVWLFLSGCLIGLGIIIGKLL